MSNLDQGSLDEGGSSGEEGPTTAALVTYEPLPVEDDGLIQGAVNNVQDAIDVIDGYLFQINDAAAAAAAIAAAHIADNSGAHAASAISNAPAGNVAATTVQGAVDELDTDKAAAVHTHTSVITFASPSSPQDGVQVPADYASYDYEILEVWGEGEARTGDITIDVLVNEVSVGWGTPPVVPLVGGVGTARVPTNTTVLQGDKVEVSLTGANGTDPAIIKMRVER